MKPTPLSSLLADDQLLDRVGARLDTDDELGSLLLAVARHVDAPIARPGPRGRRSHRHRGLTVLAALGVAVSGATVAAAIEGGPNAPATAADWAHNRVLPKTLQALGLPFVGPGLVPGRLLLPSTTSSPAGWAAVGALTGTMSSGTGPSAGLPGGSEMGLGRSARDPGGPGRHGPHGWRGRYGWLG